MTRRGFFRLLWLTTAAAFVSTPAPIVVRKAASPLYEFGFTGFKTAAKIPGEYFYASNFIEPNPRSIFKIDGGKELRSPLIYGS